MAAKSGIPLELHLMGSFLQKKEFRRKRLLKVIQSQNCNGSRFLLLLDLLLKLWTACLGARVTSPAEALRFSSKHLSQ